MRALLTVTKIGGQASRITASFITAFWVVMSITTTIAQHNNANTIPNLAPQTPEAATLGRFGQYSVHHFTGVPNTSIPLLEVKVGDISVPITLQYHASGIRVTDRAGAVGLGWALNAGGIITRQVMGIADEAYGGYLSASTVIPSNQISTTTEAGLLYLEDISTGRKDTEPDIYSYSFGSESGKFMFNQLENYSPIMTPYNPIKINRLYGGNQLSFEMYDPQGTYYKFNIKEKGSGVNDYLSTTSAWLPSLIISNNKKDTVQFSYALSAGTSFSDVLDKITVDDLIYNDPNFNHYVATTGAWTTQSVATFSEEQRLTEIKFRTGKIEFVHAEREDGWADVSNGTQKRFDAIKVYSRNGSGLYDLLKIYKLYQGYFISNDGTNTKRMRLDSLNALDATNQRIQHYGFEYNSSLNMPGFYSRKRDYWGYFNNIANITLIPRMTIDYQSNYQGGIPTTIDIASNNPTNGRDPDPNYMQACMLKKIIYPTGGWTEFDFETNRYLDANSNLKYAGGLRILQIRSYDGTSPTPIKQTFKYGNNESGYGRSNFILNNYFFVNTLTERTIYYPSNSCTNYMASKRMRTYVSQPNISIEPFDGAPIVYSNVSVYEGDETNNIGKTTYHYSDFADQPVTALFQIGVPAVTSFHFKRGLLLSETFYKKDVSGYLPIKSTGYSYSAFGDSLKMSVALKVFKSTITNKIVITSFFDDVRCLPQGLATCGPDDSYSYSYNYYNVYTGDAKLISRTESIYDQNNSSSHIDAVTTYDYANYAHQQPTAITKSLPSGQSEVTNVTYPHNHNGAEPYSTMVSKHMFAQPITSTITTAGVQRLMSQTDYSNWGSDIIAPQTVKSQYFSGPVETSINFHAYDNFGNIKSVSRTGDMVVGYLYGYNKSLPIAEIKNAMDNKITANINSTGVTSISVGGLTPQNTSKTFTVDYTGNVILKIGMTGNPGYTTYVDYSSSLGNGTMTLTNGQSCGYNQVTFSNVSTGTYTINLTVRASQSGVSVGACGQIDYPDIVPQTTGITEFFYENFEESGNGTSTPHTGKKYWNGNYTNTFIKPNSRNYVVEYWYLSSGNWQYATATYSNNMVLNGPVDNVRIYPSDAQMKSYTHTPGLGMTSSIDERGKVYKYVYDSFGRLLRILNESGGIEKQYTYNYKTN